MKIFKWSDSEEWKNTVFALMSDCISDQVIEYLRQNPPKYVVSDNSNWLDKAIGHCGFNLPTTSFQLLSDRLLKHYTKIRAFHACRPESIDEYYKNGIIPLDIVEWHAKAINLFFNSKSSEVSKSQIEAIIKGVKTETREGNVHLGLDDKFLIKYCGHYLIYGSEYLMAIAVKLGHAVKKDLTRVLRNIGIPTIFVCDIPFFKISNCEILELSGTLLEYLFESILSGTPIPSSLDFTITLNDVVESEYIISHYNPKEIPNPHSCYEIYRWENENSSIA